ncbi:hypothetical protein AK812_SmicGene22685 [Symbiodinium microadriaticum]|uniref:Uncharacterized protein n=1 Tax=Symbiodinium microadriaticum TaxID=2951 RepID=A0A1Q9DJ36_SYMMI|nr:hypothetical protein AK812_SmicGene22685 [Symbiodinium microadriaticum]
MSSLPWVEPFWNDVGLQSATTVVDILEIVDAQTLLASSRIVGFEVVITFGVDLLLDWVTSVTVVDFRVERAGDETFLRPQENSDWFLHKAPSLVPAPVFREACAGLGALGVGAAFAGFRVIGANELHVCAAAVTRFFGGCGMPFRMKLALLLAFAVNHWLVVDMRHLLEGFCQALHFNMVEVELELASVWSAQRNSCWCALLRDALPLPSLKSWEAHGPWRVVSDVLTHPQSADEDVEQMMLNAHEMAVFSSRRSLESMVVRGNVPLPMVLRAPFSVDAKCGGALIRMQCATGVQYRHVTAQELALLNGLSPETPLGDDGRLALALVAQLASPLQSCWVFAHLRQAIGPDAGEVSPIQLLTQQRRELLCAAERCGLHSAQADGLSADCDAARVQCGAVAIRTPCRVRTTAACVKPLPHAPPPSHGEVCSLRCMVPLCPGVFADVFLSGLDCGIPAWRLRTVDGVVIRPGALLLPGQTVLADLAGVPSDDALHAKVALEDVHSLIQARVDVKVREAIALEHAPWLADDQVAWALHELASRAAGIRVWADPVALTASVRAATLRILPQCQLQGDEVLISAALIAGHWVTFCWHNVGGAVWAWTSATSVEHAPSVAVVHWLFAGSAGVDLGQFRFKDEPARFLDPGLCGHAAALDLRTRLFGTRHVADVDVAGHAARAQDRYFNDVLHEATARQPCLLGGVVGSMIEHGLASLLKTKGVPEAHALARAKEVLQKVGHASVQQAMVSSQPWRQLKSLCSKLQPPLQLVLPVELQAQIAKKVQAGEDVRPKRKTKAAKEARNHVDAPKVTLPTPDLVEVPEGVFVSVGRKLLQLTPAQIGPAAAGVVLMTLSEAEPYVCISKPLSSEPLGLLVLGDLPTDIIQVRHSVERFQARWKLSGDPLLLQATLLQIGVQPVQKFVPAECTPVDVLPSALVRVAVFRDEWGQPWADFIKAPLRSVVAQCKLLTSCSVAGCTCEAFHGVSGPGEPEPILEVFGRQFLQLNLRQAAPSEAQVFNAILRIPLALEEQLQGFSGMGGIYFEPRGDSLRDPSARFSVIWVPRADHKQVLLFKQGNKDVVGLARIGSRYGVRCKVAGAQTLHEQLKPDQPFLAGGGLSQYQVGPWPHLTGC